MSFRSNDVWPSVNSPYPPFCRGLILILILSLLTASLNAQNTQVALTLERGKPVERELLGDQTHSYNITLIAGQYLHLVVEQKGIDVVVSLISADGKKLIEVDSPNGTQEAETVFFIAPITRTYRLEVRPLSQAAALGRYAVRIEELRLANEVNKHRIKAETLFGEATLLFHDAKVESFNSALAKFEEAAPSSAP